LNSLRQGQDTVASFAAKIEEITAKLTKLQILKQGQAAAATVTSINDTNALIAFQSGTNKNIQSVLLAANIDSFGKAVEIALNAEAPLQTDQEKRSVFYYKKWQSKNKNYQNQEYKNNKYKNPNNSFQNKQNGPNKNYYSTNGPNKNYYSKKPNFYKGYNHYNQKSRNYKGGEQRKINTKNKNEPSPSGSSKNSNAPLGEFSQ